MSLVLFRSSLVICVLVSRLGRVNMKVKMGLLLLLLVSVDSKTHSTAFVDAKPLEANHRLSQFQAIDTSGRKAYDQCPV